MDLYLDGQIVKLGDEILDFRGEAWTFMGVSRDAEPGKSGKVVVSKNPATREFYPTVFKGEIK